MKGAFLYFTVKTAVFFFFLLLFLTSWNQNNLISHTTAKNQIPFKHTIHYQNNNKCSKLHTISWGTAQKYHRSHLKGKLWNKHVSQRPGFTGIKLDMILHLHYSSGPILLPWAPLHFQAFCTAHPVYSDEVQRVWMSYFGITFQNLGIPMWNTAPFMHWILWSFFKF